MTRPPPLRRLQDESTHRFRAAVAAGRAPVMMLHKGSFAPRDLARKAFVPRLRLHRSGPAKNVRRVPASRVVDAVASSIGEGRA